MKLTREVAFQAEPAKLHLTEDQIAKVMGGNMMRYLAETL